ncbi:MAG: DUF2018 family protein [Campylobacterota bacterium]|nr:DUF2018 family protein [Campylobacterota bacterium]
MNKYDALFEDETDIFGGTPKSKYWDIYNQISSDLAQDEFDKILGKIAVMESMLIENMDEDLLNKKISQYVLEHSIEIEERKKSLYMEYAGDLIYRVND